MSEKSESNAEAFVVLSTCPPQQAGELAHKLVEKRLAACVNIVKELASVYRWQGKIHEDPESLLVIKTSRARIGELTDEIVALHPYAVPAVVALPVERGYEQYLRWIVEETT